MLWAISGWLLPIELPPGIRYWCWSSLLYPIMSLAAPHRSVSPAAWVTLPLMLQGACCRVCVGCIGLAVDGLMSVLNVCRQLFLKKGRVAVVVPLNEPLEVRVTQAL